HLDRRPREVQVRSVEDAQLDQLGRSRGLHRGRTLTVPRYSVPTVSELQEVLRAIEDGRDAGERMALATIVGVRGSTYRREGARLLVREAGKPVGTISGGCLEGDVRVTASEIMADGVPRLLHFDLTADDEAVWGWGLGCNGVIDVFVEPAEGAVAAAAAMRRAIDERHPLAAVVVTESMSDGLKAGARMLVRADGTAEGSLGDAALDALAG